MSEGGRDRRVPGAWRLRAASPVALAGIAMAAVMLLGAVVWLRPYVHQPRAVLSGVPAPPALQTVYPYVVGPKSVACEDSLTFDTDAQRVQITVGTYSLPAPPLRITVDAPGYHTSATAPGGYTGTQSVFVPITAPTRPVAARLCVRNVGATKVALTGTAEPPTRSRGTASVDGVQLGADFVVALYPAHHASITQHLNKIVDHASAFRPFWLRGGFLWLLLVLTAVGLPVGALAAVALSLREGDAPLGARDRSLRDVVRGAAASVAWLTARHRSLPRWARAWPMGVFLLLTTLVLYGYANRDLNFQTDEQVYLLGARIIRENFWSAALDFVDFGHGIQRLNMLLMAFSLSVKPSPGCFRLFHLLNAASYASTAIPIYLLARRLGGRTATAGLASVLAVLVPWAVTATTLLAEGTAYPVFAWVLLACVASIQEGGWRRDTVALLALAVSPLGRTSFLLLWPTFAVALVLDELLAPVPGAALTRITGLPRRLWARHRPILVVAAAALVYILVRYPPGPELTALEYRLLGVYRSATAIQWSLGPVLVRSGFFLSRIAAGIVILPFVLGTAWLAWSLRPSAPRGSRALALVGGLFAAVIVVSSFPSTLDERYTMYVAPVLIVAAALAAQQRQVPLRTLAVSGLLTALLLSHYAWPPGDVFAYFATPAGRFYDEAILGHLPGSLSPQLWGAAIALLSVVALWRASRADRPGNVLRAVLVVGVLLLALVQTRATVRGFIDRAAAGTGPSLNTRAWISEHTGGRAWAILASGQGATSDYLPVWFDARYYNPSLNGELSFNGESIYVGAFAQLIQARTARDGRVVSTSPIPDFIAVPARYHDVSLAGTTIAQSKYLPLTLKRLSRPARVEWTSTGPDPDGFVRNGATLSVTYYRPPGVTRVCGLLGLTGPPGFAGRRAYTVVGPGLRRDGAVSPATQSTIAFPLARLSAGSPSETVTLRVHGHGVIFGGRDVTIGVAGADIGPCAA